MKLLGNIVAGICHPVFLILFVPFYHMESTVPGLVMLVIYGFVAPAATFSLTSIKVLDPNITQRRFIYLVYLICLSILVLCTQWIDESAIVVNWYVHWVVAYALLLIVNFKDKASWHAMGWTLISSWLILNSNFQWISAEAIAVIPLLAIGVIILRYFQRAHTLRQLIIGMAIGVIVPYLFLLCMPKI